MQTLSSRTSNSLSPQSRKVAVFAVLLFALAGLISGFAVGGFVRPKIGGVGSTGGNNINNPVVQQTKTATPTTSGPQPMKIPIPTIDNVDTFNVPNGTTYTLTAHLDHVVGRDGQPVHAGNLTCKLWLISQVPGDQKVSIPSDILTNVSGLSNTFSVQATSRDGTPLPGVSYPEIQPGFVFNGSTPQTHSCRTDGEVTWRYQISPQATPGKYTLVVLYDWSGKHYNWYWVNITIRQAHSN